VKQINIVIYIFVGLLVFSQASQSFAGLESYLKKRVARKYKALIIPVTLRDGFESRIDFTWPFENKKTLFRDINYKRKMTLAKNAGIDLSKELKKKKVYGYENNHFFMLYYFFVKAVGCPQDYLVQRIKTTKTNYSQLGRKLEEEKFYFVEAVRLNANKETFRAKEHYHDDSLKGAKKRNTLVEIEIGCGTILEELEDIPWPFDPSETERPIQEYSNEPILYDEIKYKFSTKFKYYYKMDERGMSTVHWPTVLR